MKQEKIQTPVEIVQKLIAIHSTRKEVSERMEKNNASNDLHDKLKSAAGQSEGFMKELLNELSEFGDAVQSEVNREDEYHEILANAMGNIDTMSASELADTFKKSEDRLVNIYSQIMDSYPDLPLTLNELIAYQAREVKQTI